MKKLIFVLVLCVLLSGCTAIIIRYDSTGQNSLDLTNPNYAAASADKAKLKTGRKFELIIGRFNPINKVNK